MSVFKYNDIIYSIHGLTFNFIQENRIELSEGKNHVEVLYDKTKKLRYVDDHHDFEVSVKFEAVIEKSIEIKNFTYFEYKQQDYDNPLIWYAEATIESDDDTINIKLTYRYNEKNGNYSMKIEEINGKYTNVNLIPL